MNPVFRTSPSLYGGLMLLLAAMLVLSGFGGWAPQTYAAATEVYLSDLNWVSAKSGWKTVQKDRNVDGQPIRMNRLERLSDDGSVVQFSNGVTSYMDGDRATIKQGEKLLRSGSDVFIPALWSKAGKEIIAFSQNGYANKSWQLPDDWADVRQVDIYRLSADGLAREQSAVPVTGGTLALTLAAGAGVSIVPAGTDMNAVYGVVLDKEHVTLLPGTSQTLHAAVQPVETAGQKVVWTSLDPSVAAVDTNGLVRGLAYGKTVVRASTPDGKFSRDSIVEVAREQVKAPVSNLPSKVYDGARTVALTTETQGATIYYTLGGAEPTAQSIRYDGPITLPQGVTVIRAIAVKDGMRSSDITVHVYTIRPGTAVPSATLSGGDTVHAGQSFDLRYGITGNVYGMTAQDVTLSYDPGKVEFVSAEPLDGTRHQIAGLDRNTPGKVRILLFLLGAAQTEPGGEALKLTFKAKADSQPGNTSVSVTKLIAANGAGVETELAGAEHGIRIDVIDKTGLLAAIEQAQRTHDAAVEGNRVGQYPFGSKAVLQAAINTAKAVADRPDATQAEVEQAAADLNTALQSFLARIIKPVRGDHNNDQRLSIGDLAMVAKHYGKTKDDPEWSSIRSFDMNDDGVIDIVDLAAMARMILSS